MIIVWQNVTNSKIIGDYWGGGELVLEKHASLVFMGKTTQKSNLENSINSITTNTPDEIMCDDHGYFYSAL